MYIESNPKTKKEAKLRLAAALEAGEPRLRCFQPGPFGPDVRDGVDLAEGPHYPEPHRWYAQCTVRNGYVVKIK